VDGFLRGMFSKSDTEGDVSIPNTLVSLVLAPTARAGEYRRVGLSESKLESTFERCEESVVTIV
jgi:hypothetical protein